ncbi:MAG: hypothetical protein ACE5GW_02860 [Planctomycetota bacterium]
MVVPIVDRPGDAELLVAVAADAEDAEDLHVGLDPDRQAEDAQAHAIGGGGGEPGACAGQQRVSRAGMSRSTGR